MRKEGIRSGEFIKQNLKAILVILSRIRSNVVLDICLRRLCFLRREAILQNRVPVLF